MEKNTAKHFVLQLGSLASLYLSLGFLLSLIFGIVNIMFPDAIAEYWRVDADHSNVRLSIAMVIVFFPAYLVLTRMVNNMRRSETSGSYLVLTKWLIYLSLLVGGAVLLGDLVAIIMAFLEGEMTTRFILKAIAVFIIIGAAFYYYILDAKGHWINHEKQSVWFAAGAILVALLALGYGFSHIETPAGVREQKLDAQQVSDLQQLQWRIQDIAVSNGELPKTLADLGPGELPVAPEGRSDYRYETTEEGFQLCGQFEQPSTEAENQMYPALSGATEKMMIKNPDNWQHEAGDVCFERIVNKDGTDHTLPPGQMMKQ